MKKKIALLFCTSIICLPLHLTLLAEPPPAKGKKGDKEEVEAPKKDAPKKETPKKDPVKKDTSKEATKEVAKEPRTILKDFIDRTPYTRELAKTIPSPFKNLIVAEKLRIKAEKEAAIKKAEADAAAAASLASGNPNDAQIKIPDNDPKAKEFILVQEMRKQMEVVIQLVEIKKYELAESKLDLMDNTLSKNNVEKYRDEIAKKKLEVIAEHKDWDEINKIMASLTVDAMFVAEGKKKVALINDIAVEEGDDLNDMLSLAKDSPIILTFVSSNSLKIKYKKFTLQKELIDNDL